MGSPDSAAMLRCSPTLPGRTTRAFSPSATPALTGLRTRWGIRTVSFLTAEEGFRATPRAPELLGPAVEVEKHRAARGQEAHQITEPVIRVVEVMEHAEAAYEAEALLRRKGRASGPTLRPRRCRIRSRFLTAAITESEPSKATSASR